MHNLRELVLLVDRNTSKKVDVVGHPANYSSKMQQLYEGILLGRFEDDKDAASYLYPNNKNVESNYKKLKKRLSDRLLNTLLFIDAQQLKFNESQKAFYSCYKDFAVLKVMIGRSARNLALPLAEKILKKAIEFEYTDLTVNVLKELRHQYGTIEGNQKKFKNYNILLNKYMEAFRIELLAEEYYISLSMHFVKSRASKKDLIGTAKFYASDLENYLDKCSTQRFMFFAYTVLSLKSQIENNYSETLAVCNQAIELLKKKEKSIQKTYLLTFFIKVISCHIQLGSYEEGEKAISECLRLTEAGAFNWYIVKDYEMVLAYHSGQYEKALKAFNYAISLDGYNRLPKHYKEQWALHEAYFHYLIAIKKISPSLSVSFEMRKFRMSKFLNEAPDYSKDKRGGNISLLIIQLLFLIQHKKYDQFIDKIKALEMYSHRYLRKDDTFRSNCFIHMMLQIPKGYFNKKAVARKADKYLKKLNEVPLQVANQSGELEFIPYETLWNFVLSTLKG